MSTTNIETRSLKLVLESPEDVRARIEGMSPSEKAELSADWLALVDSATSADPWIHGFALVQRTDNTVVGYCGFKGPPTPNGVVEIAYGVAPEYQGIGIRHRSGPSIGLLRFQQQQGSRRPGAHSRGSERLDARLGQMWLPTNRRGCRSGRWSGVEMGETRRSGMTPAR